MLKEKIKFVDFNGVEREEEFLFNLSKTEVSIMELSTTGGLVEKINRMIELKDGATIMNTFEDIIFKAYGEKSPDGRRFIKSEELSVAFSQTPAYDILFMRLITNPDAAASFIQAILPKAD